MKPVGCGNVVVGEKTVSKLLDFERNIRKEEINSRVAPSHTRNCSTIRLRTDLATIELNSMYRNENLITK